MATATFRFSCDKAGAEGGSPKPIIPYLKRTGFLGSDGVPTSLYKRFRNSSQSGAAAAEALRTGYAVLFEINEYVHDAPDEELKGIVVQATGLEEASRTVQSIMGSFKALRAFADFDASADAGGADDETETDVGSDRGMRVTGTGGGPGLSLGYTINLRLSPSSDSAVFNAIFKSLRERILRD